MKISKEEQLYDLKNYDTDGAFTGLKSDTDKIYSASHAYAEGNVSSIRILYKCLDEWGDLYCFLSVIVPLENLISELMNKKIGVSGFCFLADSSGLILYHKVIENIFATLNENNDENSEIISNIKRMGTDFIECRLNGVTGYIYYSPHNQFNWSIISVFPTDEFSKPVTDLMIAVIIIIVCALGVSLLLIILVSNSISRPLLHVSETLRKSSSYIANASQQLSLSSQEIARCSTEQAASIEETGSSTDELTSIVKHNLANAREANSLARKSLQASQDGQEQMQQMLVSIREMSMSSNAVKKIIKVIDGIAFQTNILALNAAVEAARAGESGMGFSVVADEVKSLANKSAEAAKETSTMIEQLIDRIEAGAATASILSESFRNILSYSQKVCDMAKEVETASSQQDTGINQVNIAIVQLDEATQSNAGNAGEASATADEFAQQASVLRELVDKLLSIVTGKGNGTEKHNEVSIRRDQASIER